VPITIVRMPAMQKRLRREIERAGCCPIISVVL
jgi:hypothetical protein